jgi:putative FmdB family regulatory protein
MPTYEYLCPTCDATFDYFQSITAEPLSACPECHQPVQRKISGGSGIIFKGSGFYITDYKKNGNNAVKTNKSDNNETSEADKPSKEEQPKAADKSSSSEEKATDSTKKS